MQDTLIICILVTAATIILLKTIKTLRGNVMKTSSDVLEKLGGLEKLLFDIRDGTKTYFKERRASVRIRDHIAAKLKGGVDEEFLEVANISRDGAALIMRKECKKDDLLDLEIFLPLYPQPVSVKARVVDFTVLNAAAKEKPRFEVGVKFIEISLPNKERLVEAIDVLGKKGA